MRASARFLRLYSGIWRRSASIRQAQQAHARMTQPAVSRCGMTTRSGRPHRALERAAVATLRQCPDIAKAPLVNSRREDTHHRHQATKPHHDKASSARVQVRLVKMRDEGGTSRRRRQKPPRALFPTARFALVEWREKKKQLGKNLLSRNKHDSHST